MRLGIKHSMVEDWPLEAAGLIQSSVDSVLAEEGKCSVMLTGGRSAARLYEAWSDLLAASLQISCVSFYFGDERCVPPDHPESNYGMAMQTLFPKCMPPACSVFRMEADAPDLEVAAKHYADLLPHSIDVLLLGVGDDGHIASLFPNSAAIQERERRVVAITGPKPPFERLTITPRVIKNARSVFVLASGSAKAAILSVALSNSKDIAAFPARLALDGTWLLDHSPNPDDIKFIKKLNHAGESIE